MKYHSVSAFGSSMGTDIRSSFGAAILCVVFWRRKVVVCSQVQNMAALCLANRANPAALVGQGTSRGKLGIIQFLMLKMFRQTDTKWIVS